MEVQASAKFARISPKKAQPLVRTLRGARVADALTDLKYHPSKTARLLYKLIRSASSNAVNNYNLKEDNLKVKRLTVNSGPTMKRYWFRSHGAADPLLKRSSHFTVILDEIKPTLVKKPVAKPQAVSQPAAAPTSETPDANAGTTPAVKPQSIAPRPKLVSSLKKVLTRRTTNK